MSKQIRKIYPEGIQSASISQRIVCIGGGTGVSMVLSGLLEAKQDHLPELKAIVTMFDDGGSSGKIVREFNILPPGDLRQCLVTTSKDKALAKLFTYRFKKGSLKGQNLGNLLIVAAAGEEKKSFNAAINNLGRILNARADIFPVTLNKAKIKAILKNNKKIIGEENIINCRELSKSGLKKLFLEPSAAINPKARKAILEADLIVIGPGKLYTSIIPNFLVKGVPEALRTSKAKKVFICNLMTQKGNTDNFKVEDFVKAIEQYLGKGMLDYVIFNTGKLKPALINKVKKVFSGSELVGYNKKLLKADNFIGENLLDNRIRDLNPADILVKGLNQRTIVFHNSDKLAKIIIKLCRP